MKNKTNLVGLWVNLSRAYEIALLGGFSIKVVFQKEYTEGFDDYKEIKSFYKDVNFCGNGDMTIEMYKPIHQKGVRYETLDDIINRVREAEKNPAPTTFKNSACDALLSNAIDRLNLSVRNVQKVNELAAVIARIDASKYTEAHHLAEAIHYIDRYNLDEYCVAEDEVISFGHGSIVISKSYIDKEHVLSAIDYLKSLI